MLKESKFTPMPDAQTPRLRTNVELPFQLQDQIGLNVGKIQTLCQLAGFRHLKLETMEDPKSSKSAVLPIGINSHNTALGGKAKIETVPIYEESINIFGYNRLKQATWKDINIFLNQEEMKQRMFLTNKDVRQVKNWAKDINKALTQGIVRAGVEHLLTGFGYLDKGLLIGAGLFFTTELIFNKPIGSYINDYLLFQFLTNVGGYISRGPENYSNGTGIRMSLTPVLELDRAVALLLIANSSKLAKPFTSGSEPVGKT